MAGVLRRIPLAVVLVALLVGFAPSLAAAAPARTSGTLTRTTASTSQRDTAATIARASQIASAPTAPLATGKVIYVNRARQWLYAYSNGHLIFSNAVETGQPALPTPGGYYSVMRKGRNLTFTSPWPKGSPYYYYPTHINYALLFRSGGFFLHDAWWHCKFGPGGNVNHWTAGCPGWRGGHWETGSHGCIGMPISDARRLYDWAAVGTRVIVT